MFIEKIIYVSTVTAILFLTYFSYLDLKYREIPDKHIYSFISISIILSMITFTSSLMLLRRSIHIELTYLLLSLTTGPLFSYLLYKHDLFGLADVLVILGISLIFYNDFLYMIVLYNVSIVHVPPIIPLLLYANMIMAVYVPVNMIRNIVLYKDLLPPKSIGIFKWSIIVSTGKPMKIKDFLKKKHVFPLEVFKVNNDIIVRDYRTSFSIEEDYRKNQVLIKELVDKGYLSADDYIWTTYGVPFVVLVLIGFIILLLIGDSPLHYILQCITCFGG